MAGSSKTLFSDTNTIPVPPNSFIFLNEWWLVKQPTGLAVGGIACDGIDEEETLFLSSVIVEREQANVLHTRDGVTIMFHGLINASRSSLNGVPSQVCQHFVVGFPHLWKKYSSLCYGDTAAVDTTPVDTTTPDNTAPFGDIDEEDTAPVATHNAECKNNSYGRRVNRSMYKRVMTSRRSRNA